MRFLQRQNLTNSVDLFNSFCSENFIRVEPTEIVLRIKAFNNDLFGAEKIILPSYTESGIVTPEQWFTTGLNFRFFLSKNNHTLTITLENNPYLSSGFVVIIEPNEFLPNGIIINEKPNQNLNNGVILQFNFHKPTE